jgi:hypothetical protein
VIPTDSGQRAYKLWQQAGEENGFFGNGGNTVQNYITVNGNNVDITEERLVKILHRTGVLYG